MKFERRGGKKATSAKADGKKKGEADDAASKTPTADKPAKTEQP